LEVLASAVAQTGFDDTGAVLLRDGSNALYRLPDGVVARIGRPGTSSTAAKEVRVADWLAEVGFPSVRPIRGATQSVVIGDRPVTWWELLPKHRSAAPAELGTVLRALHDLSPPASLDLPRFDPFAGLTERIEGAGMLGQDDRRWLSAHLAALRGRLDRPSHDQPGKIVHGDAWQGNIAVTRNGPVLLDLEDIALGDQNWDLIPMAVDFTDFVRLTVEDYRAFIDAYGGHDVHSVAGFRDMADVWELRWLAFALSKAVTRPDAANEVRHRIACLRGEVVRPWSWAAL
jgi:hypothetical protein